MAGTHTRGELELRPFGDLAAARARPRGERGPALRDAAGDVRARLRAGGTVRAVRSVDLTLRAYPTRLAFGGTARALNPHVTLVHRLVLVQFEDFAGELRVLAWEPSLSAGAAQAPFAAQLLPRFGRLSDRLVARDVHGLASALALCELSPGDVDLVAFDDLHGQDLRGLVGTTVPVEQEHEARPPFFPHARFLVPRAELEAQRAPHPLQRPWYVANGTEELREENLELLEGDVELGAGVALVSTPGHAAGGQSLVLNTADGVRVIGAEGVAADAWHPQLSKIPGVRQWAEWWDRDVVMEGGPLGDELDQYDAMLLQKALADANRGDPRWLDVVPSAELATLRRQWPVVPTFVYGGTNLGRIERPPR